MSKRLPKEQRREVTLEDLLIYELEHPNCYEDEFADQFLKDNEDLINDLGSE